MNLKSRSNFKIFIIFITNFFLIALAWQQATAGPFISFPGARAKAMGGAFTGIADDASAVWYNPAGLAEDINILTLEWSQASTIDKKNGSLGSNGKALFLGGKFSIEDFGVGLFYYLPYTVKYWAYDNGKNDTAWGRVNETIQTISIPLALSSFDGTLKVGGSIELVQVDIDGSKISYRNAEPLPYITAQKSANGFSGSIGTLITLFERDPLPYTLRLGATYRFKSSSDIGAAALRTDSEKAVAQLFFDKPESYDIGLSLTREFSSIEAELTLAAQYGSTNWGRARKENWNLKYEKISSGLEFVVIREEAVLKRTAFRLGYYNSKPSDEGRVWAWPEVKGLTYGIGLVVGDCCDRLHLDVTQEKKSLKNSDGLNDTATLTSIALNWSF